MVNLDLSKYGISGDFEVVHNPSYETLFQDEMNPENEGFERAKLTKCGATAVYTGKFTGRSPKDKFFVMDDVSRDTLWWDGTINRPARKRRLITARIALPNSSPRQRRSTWWTPFAARTPIPD
jgi:phosphoenolpyruvate carboxykinase (ATP)